MKKKVQEEKEAKRKNRMVKDALILNFSRTKTNVKPKKRRQSPIAKKESENAVISSAIESGTSTPENKEIELESN